MCIRDSNYPDLFERYSGIPRDISRYGFTSGENDQSGICFENGWLIFQFGRGRESWGAGNDIQIGLSENSNSYDYGMLDLDFENLRVSIESLGHNISAAEISMIPKNSIKIEGKPAEHMLKMMEALEDCDDVQNVYSNFDIDDEVIEALT